MLRAARFMHGFVQPGRTRLTSGELVLDVEGCQVPATLIRPAGTHPLPGWIVLHGITVPGREHPVLVRFATALAASGAVVIVPEVPAWRRLEIRPSATRPTVAAAAKHLRDRADVSGNRHTLVGFSFGATQALVAAAHPEVSPSIATVVGFGGYCDLGRTLRCMVTGEHEWRGVEHRLEPDPYGRWIVGANYIRQVPEYAHMQALADGLRDLALEAGTRGVYAAESEYDAFKAELRQGLPEEQRKVWDILAPPAGVLPPAEPGRALAARLTAAAIRTDPEIDPSSAFPHFAQRIVLAHGHGDRLIPYTETLRLREAMPDHLDVNVTITRLFAHSREAAERPGLLDYPGEVVRYCGLLARALRPG